MKIRRNPLLCFLPLIPLFHILHSFRFPNSTDKTAILGRNLMSKKVEPSETSSDSSSSEGKNVTRIIHDSINNEPKKVVVSDPTGGIQHKNKTNQTNNVQVRFSFILYHCNGSARSSFEKMFSIPV